MRDYRKKLVPLAKEKQSKEYISDKKKHNKYSQIITAKLHSSKLDS